jgi:hypothetical protein
MGAAGSVLIPFSMQFIRMEDVERLIAEYNAFLTTHHFTVNNVVDLNPKPYTIEMYN